MRLVCELDIALQAVVESIVFVKVGLNPWQNTKTSLKK